LASSLAPPSSSLLVETRPPSLPLVVIEFVAVTESVAHDAPHSLLCPTGAHATPMSRHTRSALCIPCCQTRMHWIEAHHPAHASHARMCDYGGHGF
jgi:hypothetical protein